MEKMAASEIGFNRDAFGGPPVRKADGTAGGGPHSPSGYRDLEAIVHQPPHLTTREPPGRPPDILTCHSVRGCPWEQFAKALDQVADALPGAAGLTRIVILVLPGLCLATSFRPSRW
jgi:hypothetical protein